MKKMRFKKRAAIALALAAVMTLGTVMPVWAVDVTTGAAANTTRGGFNGSTAATVSSDQSIVVHVNIPSEFYVSIPKETALKVKASSGSYSSDTAVPNDSAVRYDAGELRAEVPVKMKGSLGTDEVLTITSSNFSLANRNGLGTNGKTHEVTVTANGKEGNTSDVSFASVSGGFTVSGVGNNGAYFSDYTRIGGWNVTNADLIGAGHWAGPMVFSISVASETDITRP